MGSKTIRVLNIPTMDSVTGVKTLDGIECNFSTMSLLNVRQKVKYVLERILSGKIRILKFADSLFGTTATYCEFYDNDNKSYLVQGLYTNGRILYTNNGVRFADDFLVFLIAHLCIKDLCIAGDGDLYLRDDSKFKLIEGISETVMELLSRHMTAELKVFPREISEETFDFNGAILKTVLGSTKDKLSIPDFLKDKLSIPDFLTDKCKLGISMKFDDFIF